MKLGLLLYILFCIVQVRLVKFFRGADYYFFPSMSLACWGVFEPELGFGDLLPHHVLPHPSNERLLIKITQATSFFI